MARALAPGSMRLWAPPCGSTCCACRLATSKRALLDGTATHLGPDVTDVTDPKSSSFTAQKNAQQPTLAYRALVRLDEQVLLSTSGERLALNPGMVAIAEVHQGRCTVLEYLLSPVRKLAQEAARER